MQNKPTVKLGLESLDDRLTPAVTAAVWGNTLFVLGDGQDDAVAVRATPGRVEVEGLGGTAVTTAASAQTARFTHVRIDLGGGADEVSVEDTRVFGRMSVAAGVGDDVVRLDGVTAADITIGLGDGADLAELGDVTATRVTIDAGTGADRVTLDGARVGHLTLQGGADDDTFVLRNTRGIRLSADGGAGSDTLDRTGTQFAWSSVRNLADDAPPTVRSVARTGGEVTSAGTVTFTVTFNEPVRSVDAADFAVAATGTLSGRVSAVARAGGSSYTVTVTDLPIAGTGTVGLNVLNDGSIRDATGVRLAGGTFVGEAYRVEVSALDAYMGGILAIVPNLFNESAIYAGVDAPTVRGQLEQVSANWGEVYAAAAAVTPVAGLGEQHAALLGAVAAERDAAALAASAADPDLPISNENYNAAYHYAPDTGYARADRLLARAELIEAAAGLGYAPPPGPDGDSFGTDITLADKPAYNSPDDPVQAATLVQTAGAADPNDPLGLVRPNVGNFEYDTIYADTGDFTFTFVNQNPSPYVFNIAVYKADAADPDGRVTLGRLVGQTDAYQGAKTHVLTLEDLEPGTYVFVDNVHPTEMRGVLVVRDYAPEAKAVAAVAAPGSASSVTFTVAYSEDVTGVDARDFQVSAGGDLAGGRVSQVIPVSGSVYRVIVTGYAVPPVNGRAVGGSGTVALTAANDGSVRDAAGQALAGGPVASAPVAVTQTALDAYTSAVLDLVPNIFGGEGRFPPSPAPTAREAYLEQAGQWAAMYAAADALEPVAGLEEEHEAVLAGVRAEEDAVRLVASLIDPSLPNTPAALAASFNRVPESGYARADRLLAREELILAAAEQGYVPPAGTAGDTFGAFAQLADTPAYNTPDDPVQAVTLDHPAVPIDPTDPLAVGRPNVGNFPYDTVYAEAGDFTFTFVNGNPAPFAYNIALYRLDGSDPDARPGYDDLVARTDVFGGPRTHVLTVESLEPGMYVYLDDAHPTQMRGLLIVS